jgi:hypothetical protein
MRYITHIWNCADRPFAYQKIEVTELDLRELPELITFTEEQAKETLAGDHVHVFNEPRSSPKGHNIFHECPGKAEVFGDNIILGEE